MMANGQNKLLYEQFSAITGCSSNRRITQYLEACGFDLAMAVDLYFAQGPDNGANDDVAMLSDEEDVQCIQSTSKNTQNTRRATRASASSAVASSSRAAPAPKPQNGYVDQEEVRAPIPSTRGQLVQHSFAQQYGSRDSRPTDGIFNRDFRAEAIEQERNLRRTLNGRSPNCEPEVRHEQPRNSTSSVSRLQSLFKPPVDIMFIGPFEGAKEAAIELGKWLLINVQDAKEFACQTLNRDIWSNSGVKELVRTNFTFWQVMHDSVDGMRLSNYYGLRSFPAIFVIDPRTGEQVFNLALKKQDPVTICDSFTSFLDKFPDYAAHDRFLTGGGMGGREQDAFGPGSVPNVAAEPECSRSAMISQDESERAMRKRKGTNEAEANGKKGKYHDIEDTLNDSTRMLSLEPTEWRKMISPNGEMCRIRLKLPCGRMETLEITDQSQLKVLFGYIASVSLLPRDHHFVLSFPRRLYSLDHAHRTLKELGFARNEMVHVELK